MTQTCQITVVPPQALSLSLPSPPPCIQEGASSDPFHPASPPPRCLQCALSVPITCLRCCGAVLPTLLLAPLLPPVPQEESTVALKKVRSQAPELFLRKLMGRDGVLKGRAGGFHLLSFLLIPSTEKADPSHILRAFESASCKGSLFTEPGFCAALRKISNTERNV